MTELPAPSVVLSLASRSASTDGASLANRNVSTDGAGSFTCIYYDAWADQKHYSVVYFCIYTPLPY